MKKTSILFLSLLVSIVLCAQQKPSMLSTDINQRTISGFKVVLIPSGHDDYGYIILQNNKAVLVNFQQTVPSGPTSNQKREEVFRAAESVIKDYQTHGRWRNTMADPVAPTLKIKSPANKS